MKLAGITKIYYTICDELPSYISELSKIKDAVLVLNDIKEIQIGPHASASSSIQTAPETDNPKSMLEFICESVPHELDYSRLAFIIQEAQGNFYLMGTKEPPFPKIKIEKNTSDPAKGQAGYLVNIEWSRSLIRANVVIPRLFK